MEDGQNALSCLLHRNSFTRLRVHARSRFFCPQLTPRAAAYLVVLSRAPPRAPPPAKRRASRKAPSSYLCKTAMRAVYFPRMSIIELFLIAVGLSMDAFAVSVCKGLSAKNVGIKEMCIAGAWFGGFQALMPFVGWILGSRFRSLIENIDHWIAFILLALIGLNMIREAAAGDKEETSASFSVKTMFVMAVATSIDALAVGIAFGLLLDTWGSIILASLFICSVTFVLSAAGVKIGSVFGARFHRKAEIAGGVILILIGLRILLSHLGII